ncbi:MAG TPA: lipid II flippase MurJ, partial [Opitutaceae bacterium]
MAGDFQKGIRLILIINVPAAAGLALLGRPIVRLIYMHGHVTHDDASRMALLLSIMVIGLPFFSVVNLMVRAFYAVKDTRTPVRVALVDFLVNITISLLFIHWLGVLGIVMASTAAIIAQAFLLDRALVRRLPQMHLGPLAPSIAKVLAGTAVMAAVVAGGWRALQALGLGSRTADAAVVAALIPAGIAAYGLTLWKLRIEGRKELEAMLSRVPVLGRLFRAPL